jgi:glutamate--cysteine ligase
MRELALRSLRISEAGLKRRARLNRCGADEAVYLEPLVEMAIANETAADRKLALFHGEWQGDIDHVFREFAY